MVSSTTSTDNNTISIQPKYVTIYDIEKDENNIVNNNSYSTTTPTTKGYVPVAKYDDENDLSSIHIIAEPIVNDTSSRCRRRRTVKKRGSISCCCICGYTTLTLLILLISLFVILGIVSYTMIAKGIQVITVDTPIDFPIVNVYEKEMEQVIDNINTFFDAILNMEDDDGTKDVTTSSTVINDLIIPSKFVNGAITHSDYLRGHAYVTMKPNELIFQTSLPMNMLPGGTDRYFVSTLDTTIISHDTIKEQDKDDDFVLYTNTANKIITTFDLGKKISNDYDGPLFIIQLLLYFDNQNMNHEWIANIQSIKFMGNDIVLPPGQEKINLLQDLYDTTKNDPTCIKIMNHIESIRIEQDRIIIHATTTNSKQESYSTSTSSETSTDDDDENENDMNSDVEVVTDIYDVNENDNTSITTTTSMTTTSSSSNNNNDNNSETMNTNHIPLLFLRQRKI